MTKFMNGVIAFALVVIAGNMTYNSIGASEKPAPHFTEEYVQVITTLLPEDGDVSSGGSFIVSGKGGLSRIRFDKESHFALMKKPEFIRVVRTKDETHYSVAKIKPSNW